MREFLSIMAGVLVVLAFIPYVRAILRGETKPAKASWFIWATLDTITLWGMYRENSVNGQIVGAVLGVWIVNGVALKYGKAGRTKLDVFCLIGAAIGISLMFLNPKWALLASLTTVFIGSFPTFLSAWKDPSGEDKVAWTMFWVSCLCAIFAVPKWTIEDAAQPITFLTVETIMMYLLFVRPPKKVLV